MLLEFATAAAQWMTGLETDLLASWHWKMLNGKWGAAVRVNHANLNE